MNIRLTRLWAAALLLGIFAMLPLVTLARPSATPTPAPTPTPVADPQITKIVRQQFVAWQAGAINEKLYAPEVMSKLTQDKIDQTAHALEGLGPLIDTVFMGPFSAPDIPPDAHGYIYQMRCSAGNVYMWMILNSGGKIATVFFKDKFDVETVERPGEPGASSATSPPPPS